MLTVEKMPNHSLKTAPRSLPPTCFFVIPPSSMLTVMSALRRHVLPHRSTLQPNLSLPVCLVVVHHAALLICLNGDNV